MTKTARDIIDYYDQCEIDYRLFWELGRSMGMHYGHWDHTTRTLRAALRRQNEVMASVAGIGTSDRVLDAGCGVGGSAIFLARTIGCTVTGITLSPRQVRRARANAAEFGVASRVSFHAMDYTETSFEPGTFDVVWALESACYADDKGAFVREAHRLLRSGGTLVVADGFAAQARYEGESAATMTAWLSNWAVNSLETVEGFAGHLHDAGFVAVTFADVTKNVMPSAWRLYLHSLYGLPLARFAQWLSLRTAVQTGNARACRHQYHAFSRGLGRYGLFHARKG